MGIKLIANTIYGIFQGQYSDRRIVGYFKDIDDAYMYTALFPGHEIEPINSLNYEFCYNENNFVYKFEIIYTQNGNGDYIRRDEINKYNLFYYCKCLKYDDSLYNKIRKDYSQLEFDIYLKKRDLDIAYKVADDYLAEILAYGDGNVYEENIELMNEKFAEPYKRKMEIKKEEEIRQQELAELKRLKEKYER